MKRFLAPILALMVAATVSAQMAHQHSATMNHDAMFVDAMTMHHEDGIGMAQMAVDKAESAELRAMAQKMIEDQRRDIERMQALRPEGPKTAMEEIHKMPGMMPMSEMEEDRARLDATTRHEFDVAFTEIMPKHHAGAITMARHEMEKGSIQGLKDIAREIVEKQSREREQLLAMHQQLHGGTKAMASSSTGRRRMAKD
jgi:uncharacterized protein (DUF305 family)